MPFDSNGNFSRIHSWEDDRINDIDIVTDHHDEEDDNFAEGLSQTFLKDGRTAMKGNLDVGNYQVKNMADGALDHDAVNRKQVLGFVDELKKSIIESINTSGLIGDIKASLQTANHGVWLLCNGQAVSRTDYADLFALISTKFGEGDGTTTFNVPDYRGKFLRGLGGDSAKDFYTLQEEGLPNIEGEYKAMELTQGAPAKVSGAFSSADSGLVGPTATGPAPNAHTILFDASKSNEIYGNSEHVTPINQAVNYFIRAQREE